ncbi:MAG: CPBP family intramembrane metalloprotease [Chloroflexi bacterium]|nr:MAG: CPBP family intramembrane metalloprotease [Chloroflexota bacterium]
MSLSFGILLIVLLISAANYVTVTGNERFFQFFDLVLLVINLPLFLMGIFYLTAPPEVLNQLTAVGGLVLPEPKQAGVVMLGMALWGAVMSLRPFRAGLMRFLPLQANSPIHALAIILSGYLVGNVLLTLTQGGLVELAETAVSASALELTLQQLIFTLIAILGVGFYIRRSPTATWQRLGLKPIRLQHIAISMRWIILLVILQASGGALWAALNPQQFDLVDGISSTLFGDIDTVGEWLLLAVASGVGEELLFRGALQPVFGIWVTSLLFAVAHVQYGITPVTFVVFLIGLALGYLRQQYSTSTAILVHAGYNFVLGLFSLIATQFTPQ